MPEGGVYFPDDGGDDAVYSDADSVQLLNRLLESALRMGDQQQQTTPEGNAAAAEYVGNSTDMRAYVNAGGDRGRYADRGRFLESLSSWRLDTARRLSMLLASQRDEGSDDSELLSTLKRQSRYWTPLLLSWLKGSDSDGESNDYNDSSLDLPLTSKQRRQRQRNNNVPSNSADRPEVSIEALRALTAYVELTSSVGGDTAASNSDNSNANNGMCSPHTPMSTTSQRLLLRHSDAVPMIVSLLSCSDPAVLEQAVWMMGSIATSGLGGASLPTSSLAGGAAGAAAKEMSKMMSERDDDGGADGENMSVAVPNTSSEMGEEDDDISPPLRSRKDTFSARDIIFASGGLPSLLKCLANNPGDVPLHRVGAWCLSSLVEGRYSSSNSSSSNSDNGNSGGGSGVGGGNSSRKHPPSEEVNVLKLLPTMRRLLNMEDAEVLTFTCWTLSHLCDGPSYHIAAVIYSDDSMVQQPKRKMTPQVGLVPRLVDLLLHPSPKVAKPALRTIGNIVCADCTDQQTQPTHDAQGNKLLHFPIVDFTEIILECEAVPCLRRLVGHHNREIQKEACWTLSNIAAGTASQIQAVIDSGAIRPLVDLVNNELTDKEVRSEACWVVLNATSCGNDTQISILIEEGCVSVLGVLLTEPNMIMMALEGIERVLQTEEARDSEDLYHKTEEELGQRPTIIKCASLIKTVVESPHNTTAVAKRAKRIWEHHFISCALCHNNYSRCRLRDWHFCNECKCHVCAHCDCRVYHLSYQEELWAEEEEKAAETKKGKKSKKAKKKAKAKEKAAEKKQAKDAVQTQPQQAQKKQQSQQQEKEKAAASGKEKGKKKANDRKSNSASPSRGTIESGATDSLGGGPGSGAEAGDNDNSGNVAPGSVGSSSNNGQPPIDLVSYLQQTGSIIALAKLMDSLYENEYIDGEDDADVDRQGQGGIALSTQ